MVNEEQQDNQCGKTPALEGQLGNILSGVERSLAVTCETIMGKMKQLEDKIQDMEKRYTELVKDAESAIKEASDTKEAKGAGDSEDAQK